MSTKAKHPPELSVEGDGLHIPDVGDWSEHKYRLLWYYADLFATSMKDKWDNRCYADLFAGSGYARIRNTDRVVQSSSLLALRVTNPFDSYIFCDYDPRCVASLRKRASILNPAARCYYIEHDVNASTSEIIAKLPPYGLSFCFVDPYKLEDIKFSTIKALSSRRVDFLILVPAMDPIRSEHIRLRKDAGVISDYLGMPSWKEAYRRAIPKIPFDIFIAKALDAQMQSIGYPYGGLSECVMIRSTANNLPLYRLIFYSKHPLGEKFWKEAKKYSDPQLSLF